MDVSELYPIFLSRVADGGFRDGWERIDECITRELLQIGEMLTRGSALFGLYPDRPYGCGALGCAYPTNTIDHRWALKVSLDPFEGPLTNIILSNDELRFSPGVALFLNVWELPQNAIERKVWVILREEISPARDKDTTKDEKVLLSEARFAGMEVNSPWAEDIDSAVSEYGRLLEEMSRTREIGSRKRRFKKLSAFMTSFYDITGIALADVHAGNIGLRTHDLTRFGGHRPSDDFVCFDVGASRIDMEVAPIELLHNPGIPVLD